MRERDYIYFWNICLEIVKIVVNLNTTPTWPLLNLLQNFEANLDRVHVNVWGVAVSRASTNHYPHFKELNFKGPMFYTYIQQ